MACKRCFISYRKLFVLLESRGRGAVYLYNCISAPTVAKLRQNKGVRTDVILRVCDFLNVQPGDIMEIRYCEDVKVVSDNE